jgi:hypothetical protein
MWEESQWGDPATFSNGYNSYNSIYENVIGTWNGTGVGNPHGILRFGRIFTDREPCLNANFLGSIAYVVSGQTAPTFYGGVSSSNDNHCLTVQDVVVFFDSTHSSLKPFFLRDDPSPTDNFATRTTEIGGTTSTIQDSWTVTTRIDADTLGSVNIWTGANQANVCFRYVNGTLTTIPLWPWPMNQRIIDATKAAGKTPVDVTATMEQLFGPIASQCNTALAVAVVPVSPTNLAVQRQP